MFQFHLTRWPTSSSMATEWRSHKKDDLRRSWETKAITRRKNPQEYLYAIKKNTELWALLLSWLQDTQLLLVQLLRRVCVCATFQIMTGRLGKAKPNRRGGKWRRKRQVGRLENRSRDDRQKDFFAFLPHEQKAEATSTTTSTVSASHLCLDVDSWRHLLQQLLMNDAASTVVGKL